MKYFNLLYQDAIHAAPGKKIVPAEEFSKLIDGKELIEKLQEEGVKQRNDAEIAHKEAQEKGHAEGYEEGLKQWSQKLAEFENTQKKAKADLEKLIVPLAIKAAKKIVAREMDIHPDVLVDIIKQSMKALSQYKRFTIWVNKQDFAVIDANRPKLKESLESFESLNVQVREEVQPHNAIIETEGGIINVDLEQLWQSLENAFTTLMRQST